jgi:hypothetical protein
VNARWLSSLNGFLHGIKWITCHGYLDCFQKPPTKGRPNTKLVDHGTPKPHMQSLIYHIVSCVKTPQEIKFCCNSMHLLEGPVTNDFALRLRAHNTLHDFGNGLGWSLEDTFLLGSHKSMVTALIGSCVEVALRATSHTRLRARDHYTSSTLIGGKGRAGPSSLHIVLEGPMEYVNARRM